MLGSSLYLSFFFALSLLSLVCLHCLLVHQNFARNLFELNQGLPMIPILDCAESSEESSEKDADALPAVPVKGPRGLAYSLLRPSRRYVCRREEARPRSAKVSESGGRYLRLRRRWP